MKNKKKKTVATTTSRSSSSALLGDYVVGSFSSPASVCKKSTKKGNKEKEALYRLFGRETTVKKVTLRPTKRAVKPPKKTQQLRETDQEVTLEGPGNTEDVKVSQSVPTAKKENSPTQQQSKPVPKKKRKLDSKILSQREDIFEFSKPKKIKVDKKPKVLATDETQDQKTVFVGNVPTNTTEKDMRQFFSKCGQIRSVRFRSIAPDDPLLPKKLIMIKRKLHPGRTNMNAYVVFKNEDSCKKAFKYNGQLFNGHCLRVDLVANNTKHDHKRSVFVGNMAYTTHEDELREHFEQCGQVEAVRVVRDSKSGLGKGFGYVLFEDPQSVELALHLDGRPFGGRDLRVKHSVAGEKQKKAQSSLKSKGRKTMGEMGDKSGAERRIAGKAQANKSKLVIKGKKKMKKKSGKKNDHNRFSKRK